VNTELQLEDQFVAQLKNAYYFAMTTVYAQGLAQLSIASAAYDYGLQLDEVIRIWRGGCIIRAACLEDFREAYQRKTALPNLLLDDEVGRRLVNLQYDARSMIMEAVNRGIPVPAFMSALAY